MGVFDWLGQNWFTLLQSAGIIGGLLFTAVSLRDDVKARRVSNLIAITHHHREIWTQLYQRPELARVLDAKIDVKRNPVRDEEELFVNLLTLHLSSVHHAMSQGLFIKLEGLRKDMDWFFALPIPKAVWERNRALQNESFVRFVEASVPEK